MLHLVLQLYAQASDSKTPPKDHNLISHLKHNIHNFKYEGDQIHSYVKTIDPDGVKLYTKEVRRSKSEESS